MALPRKPGQPVQTSSPDALISNSTAPGSVPGLPSRGAAPAGAGSYVNLQDYLRLNQPQAQAMGQKVSDYVTGEGQQVQQQLSGAQDAFSQQMKAGMGTNIVPQQQQASGPGTWVHGAPSPWTPSTPQEWAAVKQQMGQTYTGPNSLSDVTDTNVLHTNANKAAGDAQQASSFGGLAGSAGAPGLLSQVYGGKTSQGGSNLDAFLTGNSGKLGDFSQYASLGSAIDNAQRASQGQAQGAAASVDDAAQEAKDAYQRGLQQKFASTRNAMGDHPRAPNFPTGQGPGKVPVRKDGTNPYNPYAGLGGGRGY